MKNKSARILITTRCDKQCSYCCNKLPEVQEKIKFTTFDQIVNSKYDTYCITGGEPFLEIPKLSAILADLSKLKHKPKIYIYTNGILLSNNLSLWRFVDDSSGVSGINVGLHHNEKLTKVTANTAFHLNSLQIQSLFTIGEDFGVPVRFHVNEDWAKYIPRDLPIKTWKMNDCFNNTDHEDWFIV